MSYTYATHVSATKVESVHRFSFEFVVAEQAGLGHVQLLDGRLHVFQRPTSKFWWAGFHLRGKYLRTSTKQTTKKVAEAFAKEWYFKTQGEIAAGTLVGSALKFETVARDALDRYKQRVVRGERSAATYRGIEVSLKSRILPFFGKLPIESIKVTTWFAFKEYVLKKYPHLKRGTLHQYKNALRVVLNDAYRHGIIKELPIFKDEYTGRRIEAPRPWFRPPEYKRLLSVIRKHRKHLSSVQPRWLSAVDELYDYVIWTTNTGCRVSEIANTRFCDVEVKLDKEAEREYLVIRNIKGKRGTGTCRSFFGATAAFKRRIEARKITEPQKSQEKLFLEHHRDMFKQILEKAKLRFSNTQPPAKRDFVSLRATYICFRLLNGVSVYEVANNCRTSVAMIETSYAKYLGGEILEGVNKIKGSLVGWDAKE